MKKIRVRVKKIAQIIEREASSSVIFNVRCRKYPANMPAIRHINAGKNGLFILCGDKIFYFIEF